MHHETSFEQYMKSRRVMIFPFKALDLVVELGCVIMPPAHVEDQVISAVLLLEEADYLSKYLIFVK